MKAHYCVGITDRVFFRKDQKKAHKHVFFYEVDKKISYNGAKMFCRLFKKPLCVFETKKGYHFVIPAILKNAIYKTAWLFFQAFYGRFSDYKAGIKPHILRLSWKKNNNPPPKLVYSYLPQNKNYSRAHLKAFKIPYAKITTRRTFAEYCIYRLGKKAEAEK